MKKNIYLIILLFAIFSLTFNQIYAFENGFDENFFNQIDDGNINSDIEGVIWKVYGTIASILKVIAVCGVVFTGVKYMMAGAGDKGAIKQTLIYVLIGTIFVFSADAIINFVINGSLEII